MTRFRYAVRVTLAVWLWCGVAGAQSFAYQATENVYNVKNAIFSAQGDGVTDDTQPIQLAIDTANNSANCDVAIPTGVYLISKTLRVPSGCVISGRGWRSILKLADNANVIMLRNQNEKKGDTDIAIENIMLDGNKDHQSVIPHAQHSAIYMQNVSNLLIRNVHVTRSISHGLFISNNTPEGMRGQRIEHSLFDYNGASLEHKPVGGSGVAMFNGRYITMNAVHSLFNARAGFRGLGQDIVLNGCIARGNSNGGLVPQTGSSGWSINGGIFSESGPHGNNDGIRLVGVSDFQINGVVAQRNSGSGLLVLNNSDGINITGGIFSENGQSKAPLAKGQGRDGISVISTGSMPKNVIINGVLAVDRQQNKTQRYGMYVVHGAEVGIFNSSMKGNLKDPSWTP